MTRADRARHGPRPPVPVLGAAAATWWNAISQADDVTTTAAAESAPRADAMAGVGTSDINVVQRYDELASNTTLTLRGLGVCQKGKGGRIVLDGRMGPGGERR